MKRIFKTSVLALLTLVLAGSGFQSFAQERGQGGRFDPEQMRQRISTMMQERLSCTDEEWKIIGPMVEKVWEFQRTARSGGMGMPFFRPDAGGRGGDRPGGDRPEGDRPSQDRQRRPGFGGETTPEAEALQQALDSQDTSAEQIQAKLTAFRQARLAKQTELKKAQDELRKVLTVRQEATLVLMGTLE